MATIELHDVTKRFPDGTVAVRDADFTIEDGEFFILVGPSGCGKSTLLNIIVGLERPTEGTVRVDGRRVDDLDPKDRNMAMVFQSYAIYPHMSVRENLAFPLKLAKLERKEIRRRVDQAAALLELTELLDRRPASLSGGQRQRVAMGRALVREPAAFLMDEPLSNLDAKLRIQMRTEIARLQRRLGTTTVYVTHDQTEAMTLGDRVAVLRRGVVQQIGTPRELYTAPANLFVAGFIGAPSMNFLPARIERDRLLLPMAEAPVPEGVPDVGPALIAGLRPEHLVPAADAPGHWPRFEVTVDVLEWLGADLYAYFDLEAGEFAGLPEELNLPTRGGRVQGVARLDTATGAAEGDPLGLAFDPRCLHLFDAGDGRRLTPPLEPL